MRLKDTGIYWRATGTTGQLPGCEKKYPDDHMTSRHYSYRQKENGFLDFGGYFVVFVDFRAVNDCGICQRHYILTCRSM